MAKKKTKPDNPENYNSNGNLLDHQDSRPHDSAKRTKNQDVEAWLESSYNFRYNVIKQKPEWKMQDELIYTPIDKYKLLSVKRELDAVGYTISKDGLLDILCSSFSEAINPVKHYFNQLKYDGVGDYISELANTVKCKSSDKWPEYLKKWLIGVVANVFIDERCANHVMLVLTGDQGKFKTTWLENLCPRTLRPYLFTGKLNLESKDTLTLIAENLFVNIDDQLKQLHKKDENELKNLITINHVKYRRPYDPIITEYPHLCSFMGSVNGNEFLNDPTGSRRFLPFEVTDIDIKTATDPTKIDMDKVWAQAMHLFRSGVRYWFNDDEIGHLNQHNEAFSMVSTEEQLITYYYSNEKPAGLGSLKFMPTAIIHQNLEFKSRLKLIPKKIGEALVKLGFKKDRKMINNKYSNGYFLYEKTADELEMQGSMDDVKQLEVSL